MTSAYSELMTFQRETEALSQVLGRLGWDQETMMPRGSATQRGDEMAALEGVLHGRRTDPRIADWLDRAEAADDVAKAQVRAIRRSFDRASKVPARLASELARVTSLTQGVWAQAREDEDFDAFSPALAKVLALKREEAAALSSDGQLYDALLDDYEPGATSADLTAMFDALRPRLVTLREKVLGAAAHGDRVTGPFDEAAQLALSEKLAVTFGYDLSRGRIDRAVHPFSSGSGSDVRITTRTDPADPFNCFYSTIHEVGHAAYEQKIDPAYQLTPLGGGVSMGVHESQSRIYENQLGRSRAFTGWLYGQMRDVFGDFGIDGPDAFYRAVNNVRTGFIRTEADEVHYNLHVLLRYDLERDLIDGTLEVDDLQEAWNARFEADFGVKVDRPSHGVLQDVHWSCGLFGYFPTYSLGNVYAGCLNEALRKAVPTLDQDLAMGMTGPATAWLEAHVQRHGGLYQPVALMSKATGAAPSVEPLLKYLEEKFTDMHAS
ncbi:MAG: carboxypeptidase Taq [Paracoccaceae bacterium]|jgi:carboxypeptidase Taq